MSHACTGRQDGDTLECNLHDNFCSTKMDGQFHLHNLNVIKVKMKRTSWNAWQMVSHQCPSNAPFMHCNHMDTCEHVSLVSRMPLITTDIWINQIIFYLKFAPHGDEPVSTSSVSRMQLTFFSASQSQRVRTYPDRNRFRKHILHTWSSRLYKLKPFARLPLLTLFESAPFS